MYGDNTFYGCNLENLNKYSKEAWMKVVIGGNFTIAPSKIKLEELVIEQYNLVEGMSNYQSGKSWVKFYDLHESEYSKEDIKSMRKSVQQRGVRYD